jgi:TonB family protein
VAKPSPSPFTQAPPISSDFFTPRSQQPKPITAPQAERGGLNLGIGKVEQYSLAPASRNQNDIDADVQISGAQVGPDWIQQLHVWWIDHRRYPDEALRNYQQGEVVIRFDVSRTGQTSNAEILKHSGSQWLDLQTMATFGHARLPPLPPTTPEDHATITLTVRYILN